MFQYTCMDYIVPELSIEKLSQLSEVLEEYHDNLTVTETFNFLGNLVSIDSSMGFYNFLWCFKQFAEKKDYDEIILKIADFSSIDYLTPASLDKKVRELGIEDHDIKCYHLYIRNLHKAIKVLNSNVHRGVKMTKIRLKITSIKRNLTVSIFVATLVVVNFILSVIP
mmetsp:Transcript_13003/g.19611  ORF Transcript_13003/g.19611 Transcript_13003/m.19611 type:complete len:167 (+) Transcript_13003:227-727(+)|eukprot:CAMPEP_0185041294 /NCGR_PEP_ID=MMETSP1103-20130426/40366_1 /TAXON_ID=36769 /ORGANISM="Paraphysomonas bandaiensis, Strain Caron Lab Isolate" /LENGTH=166 /DNA_ID=CAMNT_0027580945 /DNA_START=179 /DNA_END=679 /DNA_ORIENTATION=+